MLPLQINGWKTASASLASQELEKNLRNLPAVNQSQILLTTGRLEIHQNDAISADNPV